MSERQPPRRWRFLNTQFGNAFFNMAVDEVLARSVAEGRSDPTIRVFGWQPPAVSFGYAQRVGRDIDLDACRRAGVDIVRRPTGGRAVLHWNELTYSVVCSEEDPDVGATIQDAYRTISRCLVAGVRTLGVDARFEPGRRPTPSPLGKDLATPCFSSTSQYEVILKGRKLIGSAQRRFAGATLQHGSLLIGPQHKRLVELLPKGHDRLRKAFADQLEAHTISLEEAGHEVAFEDVASAIRSGFAAELGARLTDRPLQTDEQRAVDQLAREKYSTDAWKFRDLARTAQPT
ncbi:MAG: octanoyltransferase [Gemmatimonadetes bacterium]|nr:octanoyltransferase [Gemmatimonadota bacterium]